MTSPTVTVFPIPARMAKLYPDALPENDALQKELKLGSTTESAGQMPPFASSSLCSIHCTENPAGMPLAPAMTLTLIDVPVDPGAHEIVGVSSEVFFPPAYIGNAARTTTARIANALTVDFMCVPLPFCELSLLFNVPSPISWQCCRSSRQ